MHPAGDEDEVDVSDQVRDGSVIRHVMRDRDGALRFTVAGEAAEFHLDFGTLLEADPTLCELPQLHRGFFAERGGLEEPWRRGHDHDHLHPDESEEEERARIEGQIAETGWFCLQVAATDEQREQDPLADFAYTVGLGRSFDGHPDLIVFDRDLEAAYDILASVVAELERGVRFTSGDLTDQVLKGSQVRFSGVPARARAGLMTYTGWLYGEDFDALQVVWQDVEGRWPREEGSRGAYQPSLAEDPRWKSRSLGDRLKRLRGR